jgi:hypothetical protein
MMEHAARKPGEEVTAKKLTHAEARLAQRLYWSGKTEAERLMAMWELNSRMAAWRGVPVDQRETNWTVRRVSRSRR